MTKADGIGRGANDIRAKRRQRSELAQRVASATKARRNEMCALLNRLKASRLETKIAEGKEAERLVEARRRSIHSLLNDYRTSREKMSRRHAEKMKRETADRRRAVRSDLLGLETSRKHAAGRYRAQATIIVGRQRSDVASFLSQRRRSRKILAKEQSESAAALTGNLTDDVATLLDNFDQEGRERAAMIGARLASYAAERQEEMAIWRGGRAGARVATGDPSARTPSPRNQPKAEPPASRRWTRPFGNLGLKASGEHPEEGSK
jgi:hypothetical protein